MVRGISIVYGIYLLLPIVLLYTAWVYKVLFGRITLRDVDTNPDYY